MVCFWPFLIFPFVKSCAGVKVNMQGSVSLGEDVVDTLTYYANQNKLSGRRLMASGEASEDSHEPDVIELIVNSAFLCRDIDFCSGERQTLVNKYVILLTESIENIFEALITDTDRKLKENSQKIVLFEGELKQLIKDMKELLIKLNEEIVEENDATYTWINLFKRINAKFQERAINFAYKRLEGSAKDIAEVMKKLTQEIVIATTVVELKFESILCSKHKVCSKSTECSQALNILLQQIERLPNDKTKEFFKVFYETLPATSFYSKISDVTGREFQFILSDMAYDDNVKTAKTVINVVQKAVENRLQMVDSNYKTESVIGRDIRLLYVILSDMDHFYSKKYKKPFRSFFSEFFEWIKNNGQIDSPMHKVMQDIQELLSFESKELIIKLTNEVKVFLEITVDPVTNE